MLKKITAIFIVLLFSATSLYADEKKEKTRLIKTAFLDLKDDDTNSSVSNKLRRGISMILNTVLLEKGYVRSLLKRNGKNINCFTGRCAAAAGRVLHADIVITGEIKKTDKKKSGTQNKIESDRDILQVDNKPVYKLVIYITDVKTGKLDLTVEEESPSEQMEGAVKNVLTKIMKYFAGEKKEKKNPVSSRSISLNILGSYVFPHDVFQSMTKAGYGMKVKPEVRDPLFRNSVFQFSFSFYSFNSENRKLEGFRSMEIGFLAGYSLRITRLFNITPLAGTGYNIYLVNENSGRNKFFYDPHIAAAIDISCLIRSNLRFLVSPSYLFFFEEDNTGRYFGINTGISFIF